MLVFHIHGRRASCSHWDVLWEFHDLRKVIAQFTSQMSLGMFKWKDLTVLGVVTSGF